MNKIPRFILKRKRHTLPTDATASSSEMRPSRGQRAALRFTLLAGVNVGVYFVYTRAIRSAKESGVRGRYHVDGKSEYEEIVKASYKNYATMGRRVQDDKKE